MKHGNCLGRVSAIWRYPVKSMAGESLDACAVTERGLLGDRAYALLDESSGLVASAKNPRLWPGLLSYGAAFIEAPITGAPLPPVRITFPDGRDVTARAVADNELSNVLGRRVVVTSCPPNRPMLQQFWPDLDESGAEERVTDEAMPPGTFFDLAAVNVLLTTTLSRLSAAYPQGKFDIRRFRPNIVITPEPNVEGDRETISVGGTLCFGDGPRLRVDSRCARCVMTTLAQGDLTKDTGILRTVVRANDGCVGLNSTVAQVGMVRVGDAVWFADL